MGLASELEHHVIDDAQSVELFSAHGHRSRAYLRLYYSAPLPFQGCLHVKSELSDIVCLKTNVYGIAIPGRTKLSHDNHFLFLSRSLLCIVPFHAISSSLVGA
jgi:hypothetical protein